MLSQSVYRTVEEPTLSSRVFRGPRLSHSLYISGMRFGLPLLATALLAPAQEFTVATLAVTPEAWNKEANFAKLTQWSQRAAAAGAQVIVAPEGFLEGYVGNDKRTPGLDRERYRAVAEPVDGILLNRVRSLAQRLQIYLMMGFAEKRGSEVFNSAVMFSPAGDLTLRYAKTHTADDEPFNTKGTEFPVADTALGRWGALICFDRRLPETARILALKGARMILVPSWGAYGEINDQMMRVRAYENGVHVVFAHPNRGLIIDPGGKILAQNAGTGDQIVMAPVKLSAGPPQHLRNRRPEIYGELLPR